MVNSMCYIQQKMNSKQEPLILWFLRRLVKVAKAPKCSAWDEKYQVARPWIMRACLAHLGPVFNLLGEISTYCVNLIEIYQ